MLLCKLSFFLNEDYYQYHLIEFVFSNVTKDIIDN